jgi:diguanylate cyclase (GGDEF)-like protein
MKLSEDRRAATSGVLFGSIALALLSWVWRGDSLLWGALSVSALAATAALVSALPAAVLTAAFVALSVVSQPSPAHLAWLLGAQLAAALGAHYLRRSVQLRWVQTERRLDQLIEAFGRLAGLGDAQAVLQELPDLIRRPEGSQVRVWVPGASEFSALSSGESAIPTSLLACAWNSEAPIYRRGASGDIWATRLTAGEERLAVLSVERERALDPAERLALHKISGAISKVLAGFRERNGSRFLVQIFSALQQEDQPLKQALQLGCQALGLRSAALFRLEAGGPRLLAASRQLGPAELAQLAGGAGAPGLVQQQARADPVFLRGVLLEVPPAPQELALCGLPQGQVPARWSLSIWGAESSWSEGKSWLLRALGQTLENHLKQQEGQEQLRRLLDLQRNLPLRDAEELYRLALEAAIAAVPGAESGELLVWQPNRQVFRRMAGGPRPGAGEAASLEEIANWHGEASWREKRARIRAEAGAVNLCLPVFQGDNPLGVLNLDNQHNPAAFAADSLAAAELFSVQLATIFHELDDRNRLEQAALTDGLSGLGNRRAFDRHLTCELARAERHGLPLSLLLMDLQGFKRVNDALGHPTGDLLLQEAAQSLLRCSRKEDLLFRWGGDEFAALLPHTNVRDAMVLAGRYISAIRKLGRGAHHLDVNIGLAGSPLDSLSPETLLRLADQRMYANKRAGISISPPGPA